MNEVTHPSGKFWLNFFILVIVLLVVLVLLVIGMRGCVSRIVDVGHQDASVVNYLRVMDDMRAALAADPDDQASRLRLAEASFRLGGVREAIKEIKTIEASGKLPDGLDKLKEDIEFYREVWDEAGRLYAESINSSEPAAFYPGIYGACSEVLEKYDAILAQRAYFLKAHLLLREGRKSEANRILEPILGKYILLNDYCQYYLARSLMVLETRRDATREFDKLLRFYPESRIAPLGLLEQVNILREEGKPDAAIKKANKLLDEFPDSTFVPVAHRKLAEIYEEMGEIKDALAERYLLIDKWPDEEEARKSVLAVRDADPVLDNFTPAEKARLLEVMVDRGMYDFAEPLLNDLASAHKGDKDLAAGAFYQLARIYYHNGDFNKCINKAREALSFNPSGPWAGKSLNRIAHAYRRKGDLPKAIENYDAAASEDPSLAPYALYNSGDLSVSKGQLTDAVDRFKRLVDGYPESSETEASLKQLFIIAYRRGDYATTLKYCDKLIGLFPMATYRRRPLLAG